MTPLAFDLAGARRAQPVILRDGTPIRLRRVCPGDEPALRGFLDAVSTDSLRLRFFGGVDRERAAASLADGASPGDLAIVAELRGGPRIIGHAASYRIGPGRAEVAFLVADSCQGRGLGAVMFTHLATAAREQGVATLEAEVLPTNRGMLTVFERSGHPVHVRPRGDAYYVEIAIATHALPLAA